VPLVALACAFLIVILAVLLMPLTVVQRYRVGTARRPARGWVAAINFVGIAVSVVLFLTGSAVTNLWVPGAFIYSLMGIAGGGILGLLGLALTRWEPSARALHYTPNRWLVLGITLVVTARLIYGFWRSWHAWRAGLTGGTWLAATGVDGSLAAGGVVLGYYLVYWAGVRRRLRGHRRTFGVGNRPMPPSRGFARRVD
jgi:hypothetical protein